MDAYGRVGLCLKEARKPVSVNVMSYEMPRGTCEAMWTALIVNCIRYD